MSEMRYGSVCSGIEAATSAWEPLGWKAVFFAEIEPFCCAVLKHHYPEVPNHGDFTKIESSEPIDLLVGGTPCQSFSVAGKRAGLDDPRGVLAFEFLRLAERLRPRWILFENVPGLLSSDEGRDFGAFIGELGKCGYSCAWRILDAQFAGVAQRRERLFVVGHLGKDWRPSAAVLFDAPGLQWDPPPSREAGQGTPGTPRVSAQDGGGNGDGVIPCLTGPGRGVERTGESRGQDPVVAICPTLPAQKNETGGDRPPGFSAETADSLIPVNPPVAQTLSSRDHKGPSCGRDGLVGTPIVTGLISHTLRAEHDASEDGTGRRTPLVAQTVTRGIQYDFNDEKKAASHLVTQEVASPLMSGGSLEASHSARSGHCKDSHIIAIRESGQGYWMEDDIAGTLDSNMGMSGHANRPAVVATMVKDGDGHSGFRDEKELVCQAFYSNESRCDNIPPENVAPPIKVSSGGKSGNPPAVAFAQNTRDEVRLQGDGDICGSLSNQPGMKQTTYVAFGINTENTGEEELMPTISQPSISGGGHPAAVAFTERTRPDGRSLECQEELAYALDNPGEGGRTQTRQVAYSMNLVSDGRQVREDEATGGVAPNHLDPHQNQESVVIVDAAPDQVSMINMGGDKGAARTREDGTSFTLNTNEPHAVGTFQQFSAAKGGSPNYGTEVCHPVNTGQDHQMAHIGMMVRRLTPKECLRLQGFPDDYLDITYRGKPAADGPKYRAIGNSMAVPVIRWLGKRIQMVQEILDERNL